LLSHGLGSAQHGRFDFFFQPILDYGSQNKSDDQEKHSK
jgi:hypothetical protein